MDKLKKLQQLGLNAKEIQIYSALLSLGPSPAKVIAKSTEIKRPSIYFTLARLITRGLVSQTEIGKKEVFKAENPEILIRLAKENTERAKELEKDLEKLIPPLKKIAKTKSQNLRIRVLEAKEGLWDIANDTLKERKDIYVFGSFQKLYEVYSAKRLDEYGKQRVKRRIKLKVLTDIHPESIKAHIGQDFTYQEYRFLPKDIRLDTYFILYGNKTVLATAKKPLTGVIIEDGTITSAIKIMFDALWKEMEGKNLPIASEQ